MIAKLMRMQLLEEADVEATGSSSPDEEKRMADGRPAWMRTLHTSVTTWLKLVPQVSHQHSFFPSQRCMFDVVSFKVKLLFCPSPFHSMLKCVTVLCGSLNLLPLNIIAVFSEVWPKSVGVFVWRLLLFLFLTCLQDESVLWWVASWWLLWWVQPQCSWSNSSTSGSQHGEWMEGCSGS